MSSGLPFEGDAMSRLVRVRLRRLRLGKRADLFEKTRKLLSFQTRAKVETLNHLLEFIVNVS